MPSLDSRDRRDIEETLGELDSIEEELEYLDAEEGLTPGKLEEAMSEYHSVPGRPTSTGGEGAFTQWVHGEFMVSSEAICPPNTHWAHAEYF